MSRALPLPSDLRVLVRGWLHGNVIVVGDDEASLTVVDSGYGDDVEATLDWVDTTTASSTAPLETLLLTHVHSDHAGGASALARRGLSVVAHPAAAEVVRTWCPRSLWLEHTGQVLAPFEIGETLSPGATVLLGGRPWTAIDLPGHARGGLGFFDEARGILICGDALWQQGLGVLRPIIDGSQVFDDALASLTRIEALAPELLIPGHGEPFGGASVLAEALAQARQKIRRWQRDARAHRQHLLASFAGFYLLANPGAPVDALRSLLARLEDGPGDLDEAQRALEALELGEILRIEGDEALPGPRLVR